MGRGILEYNISRRRFIAGSAVAIGAAASMGLGQCDPALIRRVQQNKKPETPHHRILAWQFSADGGLDALASALAGKGLGIVVKTHDGTDWMSTYDHAPDAITGPDRVADVARYFEDRGVPFHAWCVPKGLDPDREANMAADVLAAGARSLVLDLEGSSGFWSAGGAEAVRYGEVLRARSPFGRVDVSIDPRPWRINLAPMNEFVAFCDGIWPQLYWDTFNTPDNADGYSRSGFPVPSTGITPEFIVDVAAQVLAAYERDIIPVGQGAAADPATWPRFAHRCWEHQLFSLSVWRLGVTRAETLQYLANTVPGAEPVAPPPTPTPTQPTPNPFATKTSTPTPTRTHAPASATSTPTRTNTPAPASSTSTSAPSATASFTSTPHP